MRTKTGKKMDTGRTIHFPHADARSGIDAWYGRGGKIVCYRMMDTVQRGVRRCVGYGNLTLGILSGF